MADVDEIEWIKINEPWRLKNPKVVIHEKDEKVPQIRPVEARTWDFMGLVKIKGIGKERAKDLGRIFKTEEELIKALKENRVPLRNDIVDLLKEHFKINGGN